MQDLLEKGEALFVKGSFEEAERAFLACTSDKTNNPALAGRAFNNLGVIAYQKQNPTMAASYFMQAVALDSANIDAVTNLCELLKGSNGLHEATELLKTLATKYPDNRQLTSLLAEAIAQKRSVTDTSTDSVTSGQAGVLKLRVLQGVYEVANQMNTITRALNNLGMTAKTLCYYPNYLKFKSDFVMDIMRFQDKNEALQQSRRVAEKLIPQFDVFHFHFGMTLALDHSDLPLLKKLGKKMVTHYWGSEVRMLSKAIRINPYIKVKVKNEDQIKSNLEHMSKYVSHCIVGDYELYEYVKDYFEHVHVIPVLIDIDAYKPSPEPSPVKKFTIVHAPTSPEIKGSQFIIRALNELKSRYDFDFNLIQGTSHEEAKKLYQQADLIVDELHCGTYGLLTVETMAMGKPVITWISDYMKGKYPAELPVISANPDTVKDKIEFALNNRELLTDLGRQGRAYAEKYHDMHKVIHQIVDVYGQL